MKVVIALDDSPFSQTVLNSVRYRKWTAGTQFKLVCVIETLRKDLMAMFEKEEHIERKEIERTRKKHVEKMCTKALHSIEEAVQGSVVQCEIRTGSPATETVAAAAAWDADTVLIGARGPRLCPHNLCGSVSRSVAHLASCTVEIIRPGRHLLRPWRGD